MREPIQTGDTTTTGIPLGELKQSVNLTIMPLQFPQNEELLADLYCNRVVLVAGAPGRLRITDRKLQFDPILWFKLLFKRVQIDIAEIVHVRSQRFFGLPMNVIEITTGTGDEYKFQVSHFRLNELICLIRRLIADDKSH